MTTRSSPDLTAVRAGLLTWFAALLTITASVVRWEDEPQQMGIGSVGMLRTLADVGLGWEENQHELASPAGPAGQEITRAVGGPRVLSISLVLDGYDQRLPQGPFFTLVSASTKIRGEDSIATLRALGLAVVEVMGVTNVPRVENGRTYPRAVLDVRLGYTRVETVPATTYVEKVRVTSHMRDVDGVELPRPPNATVEIGT